MVKLAAAVVFIVLTPMLATAKNLHATLPGCPEGMYLSPYRGTCVLIEDKKYEEINHALDEDKTIKKVLRECQRGRSAILAKGIDIYSKKMNITVNGMKVVLDFQCTFDEVKENLIEMVIKKGDYLIGSYLFVGNDGFPIK